MGVLYVEDRVVLRLLGDLGEVEIERLIVAPCQHDEAEDVAADLVDHLAQGDEGVAARFDITRTGWPLSQQVDEPGTA